MSLETRFEAGCYIRYRIENNTIIIEDASRRRELKSTLTSRVIHILHAMTLLELGDAITSCEKEWDSFRKHTKARESGVSGKDGTRDGVKHGE